MKTVNDIKVILFNEEDIDNEITKRFLNLKNIEKIGFKENDNLSFQIDLLQNQGYTSKEVVILKPFKGRFFQQCPGSTGVICCNYKLVNTGFNCLYNCAYCFLNSYLNSFGIIQFTNIENLYIEIEDFLKNMDKNFVYRIGSGEYTDSLMMDEITGIGKCVIEKFSSARNVMIEFKTKSNKVDHLLSIKRKGSAVLSWSLNTERNISKYEEGTSSLKDRLNAARKACDAGFLLAFHFDPIIIYKEWREDYKRLINNLCSNINLNRIVWISMGCFRYSPDFKEITRDNFPDEELTVEEMFPGVDGKYRYLKNKRVDIYNAIKGYLYDYTKRPFLYLCMESDDVWNSVLSKYYGSSDHLEKDFSEYLKTYL